MVSPKETENSDLWFKVTAAFDTASLSVEAVKSLAAKANLSQEELKKIPDYDLFVRIEEEIEKDKNFIKNVFSLDPNLPRISEIRMFLAEYAKLINNQDLMNKLQN